jgi:hypothetical protein
VITANDARATYSNGNPSSMALASMPGVLVPIEIEIKGCAD